MKFTTEKWPLVEGVKVVGARKQKRVELMELKLFLSNRPAEKKKIKKKDHPIVV